MPDRICYRANCDETARFQPVFMVPIPGQEEAAGVAFDLAVCPRCKVEITNDDLLTDSGRAQIAAAVKARTGVDVDWSTVTLAWDPVPTGDDEGRPTFEGVYLTDDPEVMPIWNEAVALVNGFLSSGSTFNESATRLTALGVVLLVAGYRHYRTEQDPAGGQLFLSSLMRSVSAQVEDQFGDVLSIRVRAKNLGLERGSLDQAEQKARQIGESLSDQIPEGWGFTLVLSELTKPGQTGFSTYLSNCKREDAIKILRETADQMEARGAG